MNNYEVKDSKYVPLATVRKVLRKRNKADLSYEQKMTLENAEEFTNLGERESNSLIKALKKLDIHKLRDEYIVKIADVAPNTEEELLLILKTSKLSFKDEEVKQILDVIKENIK